MSMFYDEVLDLVCEFTLAYAHDTDRVVDRKNKGKKEELW